MLLNMVLNAGAVGMLLHTSGKYKTFVLDCGS
jgi:hypothetical protein